MSAIPCASVSLKTMADGTLRISFDIEPMNAQDAFRLFAAPGTPAAIAALQVGYAAVTEPAKKEPIGPLCMLAVKWCGEPEFWNWLLTVNFSAFDKTSAALCVKQICNVDSRKDIDTDPQAAERFHRLIRGPYSKYLIARGITA